MNSDNMTYKLTILFLLKNAASPLTTSQISEYILRQLDVNYFQLLQSLGELREKNLVAADVYPGKTLYSITDDGLSTLSFFEKDLPEALKEGLTRVLRESGFEIENRILTPAEFVTDRKGSTVICRILDDHSPILELKMAVPSAETARTICENWALRSQEIYDLLMETLL